MGRGLRHYGESGVYFVTARTTDGAMFLSPSKNTNEIVGGVLGRALAQFKGQVRLRGFVVMSNHLHLLVHTRGAALSAFMQYLLGNIARKMNHRLSRQGAFWMRRFSAEPVLDATAELALLRYVMSHGVKEGLVRCAEAWPGLSSVNSLLGIEQRFSARAADGSMQVYPIEVQPVQAWGDMTELVRRQLVRALLNEVRLQYQHEFETVAGVRAVMRVNPFTRRKLLRRPAPLCHSSDPNLARQWSEYTVAFLEQYREAVRRLRLGLGTYDPGFPPNAFAPPIGVIAPLPPSSPTSSSPSPVDGGTDG